ncbi:MAG: hypothetical protein JXQ75_21805 [Phycisphaerae bacterium]|nr:hypothetical protein [Phycisphaerae bacterium]
MLDLHVARDRAVHRAIETGEMPNFDLIHTMQKADGYKPCFGRATEFCQQVTCRWHAQCMALATFQPKASPRIAGPRHRPFQRLPRTGVGTYRDDVQRPVGIGSPAGDPVDDHHNTPTATASPAPQPMPANA